ncbi:MFS transporter [Streptomyces sp. NPDC050560]|uniref:MFS transporter n=1 Tax=Streptomyces sp. NPDC050560 TaxID=3365630 RepID=UPI0037BA831C
MAWTVGRVLRDRNAGLYLGAVVVSQFGSSSMWLVSGIWVKELTGSNGLAALCTFALWLPTLAGPLLGTLADRTRRGPLLVALNLGMAALMTSLLTVDSEGRLWVLFGVLVVYGAVNAVSDAAEAALVTAAVGKELLGDFNGLRMSANEGMKLVAPLAGAGLYAASGGSSVALLDAVTFVLAAAMYRAVRAPEAPPAPPAEGWRRRTAEGARELWRHRGARALVVAGAVTLGLSSLASALQYAVLDRIHRPPEFLAVLSMVQGAGSVLVGAASGALMRRLGARRFGAYGIALAGLAAASRALPYEWVVVAASLANGLGLPCVLIAALTEVQRRVRGELLGRAAATANTLVFGPNAVALAVGAGLAAFADLRYALPAVGLAGLVTAGALLRARTDEARTAPAAEEAV